MVAQMSPAMQRRLKGIILTEYYAFVVKAYDNASSSQKALVAFKNGAHPIFVGPRNRFPWATQTQIGDLYNWFCVDPQWDKEQGLDLINHFTTAFLLDTLKGDKDAHKALLPDAAKFAGIEYKTTMK